MAANISNFEEEKKIKCTPVWLTYWRTPRFREAAGAADSQQEFQETVRGLKGRGGGGGGGGGGGISNLIVLEWRGYLVGNLFNKVIFKCCFTIFNESSPMWK